MISIYEIKMRLRKKKINRFLSDFGIRIWQDIWCFGILLSTGDIMLVSTINDISDDGQWIHVEMRESKNLFTGSKEIEEKCFCSPTSRTTATIRVSHIVSMFELAD